MNICVPVAKVLFDVNTLTFPVDDAWSIVVDAVPEPNCTLKNWPVPGGSVFSTTDVSVNAAIGTSVLVVVPACHAVDVAMASRLRGMHDRNIPDVTVKSGESVLAPVPPCTAGSMVAAARARL